LTPIPFFIILLLTATATVLPPGETVIENDNAELPDGENLDLSQNVKDVPETTETVGGEEVVLSQEVKLVSSDGGELTISNTAVSNVVIEIPDQTTISAPDSWNGEIQPPTSVSTSGTVTGNFLTPTSSISVGSPDEVLVFDTAVILLLEGITGQTAYKIPGTTNWINISGCTGTFESPDDPPANGECSISNGVDTKIVTFHFTEFAGLSSPAPSTSTPSTSSSGGHGNTGVGSPRIFGSSGGSSGGGYYGPSQTGPISFPSWFDNVSDWYREGKISAKEFLWAYQWIVENVIK